MMNYKHKEEKFSKEVLFKKKKKLANVYLAFWNLSLYKCQVLWNADAYVQLQGM